MPNTHPKSVGGPYPHIFNPKGADCTTDCSACRSPPTADSPWAPREEPVWWAVHLPAHIFAQNIDSGEMNVMKERAPA